MEKYLKYLGAGVYAATFAVVIFVFAALVATLVFVTFRLFLGLFGIQIVPATGPSPVAAIMVMALVLWALVVLPFLGWILIERDEYEKEAISFESSAELLKYEVRTLRKKLESETTDSTT